MKINKKIAIVILLCSSMFVLQSFKQQQHKHDDDDKFTNLQILPAATTGKEIHEIMKSFCISLGVHCNYCHVAHEVPGQQRPQMDFASDDKPEKKTAREMMKMTMAINTEHLAKIKAMGDPLEQIRCVTCHMGRTTPIISVDSLPRTPRAANDRH